MRVQQIPRVKTCEDCPTVFLGTPRKRFCDVCGTRRSRASDKAKVQRRIDHEHRDHLSPGQVEQVFQAALKQIRAERRYTGEQSWQMSWKYTDPGR